MVTADEALDDADALTENVLAALIIERRVGALDGLGTKEADADAFSFPTAMEIPQASGIWITSW
jgi:hypothetical protein